MISTALTPPQQGFADHLAIPSPSIIHKVAAQRRHLSLAAFLTAGAVSVAVIGGIAGLPAIIVMGGSAVYGVVQYFRLDLG